MNKVRIVPEKSQSALDKLADEIDSDPVFQRVIGKKSARLPEPTDAGGVQVIGNLWLAPSPIATLLLQGIEQVIGRVGGDGKEKNLFSTRVATPDKRDPHGSLLGNLAVLLAAPSAGWSQRKITDLHTEIFGSLDVFPQFDISDVPFLRGADAFYTDHMVLETLVRYRNVGVEHARRWFDVLKRAITRLDNTQDVLGGCAFIARGVTSSAQGTSLIANPEGTSLSSTAALALLYGVFGEQDPGFINGIENHFTKVPLVKGGKALFYYVNKENPAPPTWCADPGENVLVAMAKMIHGHGAGLLSALEDEHILNQMRMGSVVVRNACQGSEEYIYLAHTALLALAYQMQEGEKRKQVCQK